jgi:hypothetical protein
MTQISRITDRESSRIPSRVHRTRIDADSFVRVHGTRISADFLVRIHGARISRITDRESRGFFSGPRDADWRGFLRPDSRDANQRGFLLVFTGRGSRGFFFGPRDADWRGFLVQIHGTRISADLLVRIQDADDADLANRRPRIYEVSTWGP